MNFSFKPLSPKTWVDFVELFGTKGACGGCWCTSWRRPTKEFESNKGENNKNFLKSIVDSGKEIGLLAYADGKAVGWCSVSPREEFVKLTRSKVLAPVDGKAVWSISCLFIAKDFRNQGLSSLLAKETAAFAKSKGAKLVEAYPQDLKSGTLPAPFVWTGLIGTYLKAGFKEVERRSPTRPILRK